MDAAVYYPPLTDEAAQAVVVILQLCAARPDYFTDAECPYPPEFIQGLAKVMVKPEAPKTATPPAPTGDKWQQLEAECRVLFDQLKESYSTIKNEEVAERMTYFRTATSLLDKLVGLQERAAGLKQMSEFQNMVIQFLDEICTPDQRTTLMERLATVQTSETSNVQTKADLAEAAPEDHPGATAS